MSQVLLSWTPLTEFYYTNSIFYTMRNVVKKFNKNSEKDVFLILFEKLSS